MEFLFAHVLERIMFGAAAAVGCAYFGFRVARSSTTSVVSDGGLGHVGLARQLFRIGVAGVPAALGLIFIVLLAVRSSQPDETSGGVRVSIDTVRPVLRTLTSAESLLAQAELVIEEPRWKPVFDSLLSLEGASTLRALIQRKEHFRVAKQRLVSRFFSEDDVRLWRDAGNEFESRVRDDGRRRRMRQLQALMNEGVEYDK